MLEMMEKELMDKARVTSYSFSGNTLQLQLKMTRFGVASELLEALYQVPMVEYVSISNATDDLRTLTEGERESGESTVIMTITLREVEEK